MLCDNYDSNKLRNWKAIEYYLLLESDYSILFSILLLVIPLYYYGHYYHFTLRSWQYLQISANHLTDLWVSLKIQKRGYLVYKWLRIVMKNNDNRKRYKHISQVHTTLQEIGILYATDNKWLLYCKLITNIPVWLNWNLKPTVLVW